MIEGKDLLDIKHELNIIQSWQKSLNITADHTVSNNERFNVFIGVTSTTTMTVTLPTVANNKNREITIFQNIAAGKMLIDGNGAETINGVTTTAITTQYNYTTLKCTGTEWLIIT